MNFEQGSALFTGDCIFHGGVGMFFEGTPNQMHNILVEVTQSVSEDTRLFYGHDYGLKNLHWAMAFVAEKRPETKEINPIETFYNKAIQYWKDR